MSGMGRREFVALLGGAAAWPLAVGAQQTGMPVIGFLGSRSPTESAYVVAAFRRGLSETGFVEGQNCVIAFRWAEGRYDQLPALASELVGLRVAVLFTAGGTPPALAAKVATSTIPIVFSATNDPVRFGLVATLNAPGGNVTGMGAFNLTLAGKRLESLQQLVPTAAAIGYLVNLTSPTGEAESADARAAAGGLGIDLHVVNASKDHDLDAAFASLVQLRVGALVVAGEPYFDSQRDRLVGLSARHAIPTSYAWREYVAAGGLMSYGTSLTDSYRRAGIYVGRILKGENPADLPVMQPTKFEFAINLKTAKALGLTVPDKVLALADEVIE
jgi:putative ABC transport system substrate-binding protein